MKITDRYSKQDIINACNRHIKCRSGLCSAFLFANFSPIPILKQLKGNKSNQCWYWTNPYTTNQKLKEQAFNQRAIMLAFLLTWVNDPDFEV